MQSDVLHGVGVQGFVGEPHGVIVAAVQGDVEGEAEGLHEADKVGVSVCYVSLMADFKAFFNSSS